MRPTTAVILVTLSLLALCGTAPVKADRGVASIRLYANPTPIAADGKSECTISATVRDNQGAIVPDGIKVQFSASLGVIEQEATTRAGVARVKLVSSSITGVSEITATWLDGPALAQIQVMFVEALAAVSGQPYMEITADDYLVYNVDYQDKKSIEAIGNVLFQYRFLQLRAHSLNVDVDGNRLLARSQGLDRPVAVTGPGGTFEGEWLYLDLGTNKGFIISPSKGVCSVDAITGEVKPVGAESGYEPGVFTAPEPSDGYVLVKARKIVLFPGDRVQFTRAAIFVGGKRVITIPFHVMSLTGVPPEGQEYIGIGTEGVTVNLPFYYSLTPTSSGAMLVQHGVSSGWGWYGQQPDWMLHVRQKYSTGKSQGEFVVSEITDEDWGLHLTHDQDMGNKTRMHVYVDYAGHKDLFGNLSLTKSFKNISAGLSMNGSSFYEGYHSLGTSLYFRTNSKPVGRLPVNYTVSTRSAFTTSTKGNVFKQSLDADLSTLSLALSPSISLRAAAGAGYVFGDPAQSGMSSVGSVLVNWKISKLNTASFSYGVSERATLYIVDSSTGELTESESSRVTQTVSARASFTDGQKWRASLTAMKRIGYDSTTAFGEVTYRLAPNWRVGVTTTWNRILGGEYSDMDLALGWSVGNRELLAVWSQSQQSIAVQLGYPGF